MTDIICRQRTTYPGKTLQAFPEGFRMTAGNPELRTYNDTEAQQAITYVCLDYAGGGPPQSNTFPTVNCPDGIRTQVYFPACSNGSLDSTDHQSHMAYPIQNDDSGTCPDSHPQPVISIFYEVIWDTGKFANDWYGSGQPFVLSMGDNTGRCSTLLIISRRSFLTATFRLRTSRRLRLCLLPLCTDEANYVYLRLMAGMSLCFRTQSLIAMILVVMFPHVNILLRSRTR